MSPNLCRLCFHEKTRPKPIEIFSAEGIDLDVAAVIRLHFLDKVIESDNLPKSICRGCWTLVRNFHNLYNTVNEAQNDFLTKFVENEEPKFMQINCDPVVLLEDISSFKFKPPPDDAVAEIENSSRKNNEFDDENDASGSDTDESGGSPIDHDGAGKLSNDENKTDSDSMEEEGSEYDPNEEKVSRRGKEAKNKTGTNGTSSNREYHHLISEYMDMQCEICKHPFRKFSEARKHYQTQHQRKAATLKCCQISMRFQEIYSHIEYHQKPDKFKCSECGKLFVTRLKLSKHLTRHVPKQFECDICQKIYQTMDGIQSHMKVKHTNPEQHKCELCGKCFPLKCALAKHVSQVHERRFEQVCHICAKVCSSKGGLNQHMMVHKDVSEPRETCEYCGKSFKSKLITRIHIKNTHMQDGTVYECPQCQKQFDRKIVLARHIAYYHNFKIFKCDICGKGFKKATALEVHVTMHTGVKLHRCRYCPLHFRSNRKKLIHCEQMHPNEKIDE